MTLMTKFLGASAALALTAGAALADPAPTRAIPANTPGAAAWLLQATLPDAATRNLSLPGALTPLEVTRFSIRLVPD